MTFDLSELTVIPATPTLKEAYTYACWKVPEWGNGMSLEAFQGIVQRELGEGGWAKDGGDQTWVLINRNDPDVLLAGCETHRVHSFVKRKGDDKVEDAWIYGMTGVVTPRQHQRRGFARRMLQLMHYILADPSDLPKFPPQWGTPPSITGHLRRQVPYGSASILWSDIGDGYYETCTVGLSLPGWIVRPEDQLELTWPIKTNLQHPAKASVQPVPPHVQGWKVLFDCHVDRAASVISHSARRRLKAADNSTHDVFTQDPESTGTLAFVHQRATFGPQPTWRLSPRDEPVGLARSGHVVMFTRWNYQIAPCLLITCIHEVVPEDVESLVKALDEICCGTGIQEAMAWSVDPESPLAREITRVRGGRSKLRSGVGAHLLGTVYYSRGGVEEKGGQGELLDKQMWNWL